MTEIDKKAVGQRIKSIRLSLGMTTTQFSNLFRATKGTISKWENGYYLPNNKRLSDIAFYGQTSVDELLYGKEPCVWQYDDQWDFYTTSCGLNWQIGNPDTPQQNNMNYCPKCGKELQLRE